MHPIIRTLCCLAAFGLAAPVQAQTYSDQQIDQVAIKMLEMFLYDAAKREAYVRKNPRAKRANDQLAAFPPVIRKQMLDIVVDLVKLEKQKGLRHHKALRKQGPEAAMLGLPGHIQAKIRRLAATLSKDKSFNNPGNLQRLMPLFKLQGQGRSD